MTAPTRNPWKPRVARDHDGWVVLLDGRWRLHESWAAAISAALDRCNDHSAGCGQKATSASPTATPREIS